MIERLIGLLMLLMQSTAVTLLLMTAIRARIHSVRIRVRFRDPWFCFLTSAAVLMLTRRVTAIVLDPRHPESLLVFVDRFLLPGMISFCLAAAAACLYVAVQDVKNSGQAR